MPQTYRISKLDYTGKVIDVFQLTGNTDSCRVLEMAKDEPYLFVGDTTGNIHVCRIERNNLFELGTIPAAAVSIGGLCYNGKYFVTTFITAAQYRTRLSDHAGNNIDQSALGAPVVGDITWDGKKYWFENNMLNVMVAYEFHNNRTISTFPINTSEAGVCHDGKYFITREIGAGINVRDMSGNLIRTIAVGGSVVIGRTQVPGIAADGKFIYILENQTA